MICKTGFRFGFNLMCFPFAKRYKKAQLKALSIGKFNLLLFHLHTIQFVLIDFWWRNNDISSDIKAEENDFPSYMNIKCVSSYLFTRNNVRNFNYMLFILNWSAFLLWINFFFETFLGNRIFRLLWGTTFIWWFLRGMDIF